MQTLAYREYLTLRGRGDGWEALGCGLAALVFGPLQLTTAVVLMLSYIRGPRSGSAQTAVERAPGMYGLDEYASGRARATRTVRAAAWMLGVPTVVMAACVVLRWFDSPFLIGVALALPNSMLCIALWFGGLCAAGSALSRDDDASLLAVAALFPALALAYFSM